MDYIENLLQELEELRNKKQSEKELPSMRCATVHPPQVLPDFCTPQVPISTLDTSIKERERSLLSLEEKLKTKSPSLPKDIKENISLFATFPLHFSNLLFPDSNLPSCYTKQRTIVQKELSVGRNRENYH